MTTPWHVTPADITRLAEHFTAQGLPHEAAMLRRYVEQQGHLEEAAALLRELWTLQESSGDELDLGGMARVARKHKDWVESDHYCGHLIRDGQTTIGACQRPRGHDGEHQRGQPPSPPVAPEPAQDGNWMRRIRETLTSSGEAAGDGVTHPVGSAEYWHDRFSKCLAMLEEAQAKQEQAEREAAAHYDAMRAERDHYAHEASRIGRDMMALADELNTAKEDRDAERAQKGT